MKKINTITVSCGAWETTQETSINREEEISNDIELELQMCIEAVQIIKAHNKYSKDCAYKAILNDNVHKKEYRIPNSKTAPLNMLCQDKEEKR